MSLNPPQAYRKTDFTHRRGPAASRPNAADVLKGTLYFSTDSAVLERSNGVAWEPYSGSGGGGGVGPHQSTHQVGGTDELVNNAWKNRNNVFTENQTLLKSIPQLFLVDSSQPAGNRTFDIINFSKEVQIRALSDDFLTAAAVPARFDRTGNIFAGAYYYELGRGYPQGYWITAPYAAGNFTVAPTGTWTVEAGDQVVLQYMLIGKTVYINFAIVGSTITSAATELRMVIPGGLQSVTHATGFCQFYGTPQEVIIIIVNAGATFLSLQRQNGAAWGNGDCTIRGQVFFEVF
jgi:hypothetical protein